MVPVQRYLFITMGLLLSLNIIFMSKFQTLESIRGKEAILGCEKNLDTCANMMNKQQIEYNNMKEDFQILLKEKLYLESRIEQLFQNQNVSDPPEKIMHRNKAERIIHDHLMEYQFPENCSAPDLRFLICDNQKTRGTGFGCQLHHFVTCLVTGWLTNRTVVLDFRSGWTYKGIECDKDTFWECYFQPISKCTLKDTISENKADWSDKTMYDRNYKTLILQHRRSLDFVKHWVPEDLLTVVKNFHSNPQLFFIGHLDKFMLRMNTRVEEGYIQFKKNLFGSQNLIRPILGVHARGDDSSKERSIIYLDEMMEHAPRGYTHVYLATDDEKNLNIAKKLTNYTFHLGYSNALDFKSRYQQGSVERLVFDMNLLSECDHFLGSDGSHISRTAYELMQTRHIDATERGWSIHTILKDKKNGFFWFLI